MSVWEKDMAADCENGASKPPEKVTKNGLEMV